MDINFKVFELNGVSLPLDVDDMSVNRRIDAALNGLLERGPMIDALTNVGDKAYALVDSMRTCINEAFGDEAAADKYFRDECHLSALNRMFNELAYHIGAMRSTAFNAANKVFTAANAARVLKTAAPAQGDETTEVKYMGKPFQAAQEAQGDAPAPAAPNVLPLKKANRPPAYKGGRKPQK